MWKCLFLNNCKFFFVGLFYQIISVVLLFQVLSFVLNFLHSYDYYSFSVIPSVGKLVADDRESYQYLVESIRRFPSQVSISLYDYIHSSIFHILLQLARIGFLKRMWSHTLLECLVITLVKLRNDFFFAGKVCWNDL